MGETSPDAAAPSVGTHAAFRVLTARFAGRAASQLLTRNTWDQLWLQAFGDDIAAQAIISDCHFAVQLNHFIPGFLSYSVAVFLK
jgi:hypothetical protein